LADLTQLGPTASLARTAIPDGFADNLPSNTGGPFDHAHDSNSQESVVQSACGKLLSSVFGHVCLRFGKDRPARSLLPNDMLDIPEPEDMFRQRIQSFFTYLWWYVPNIEEEATFDALDRKEHLGSIKFRALVLAMGAMSTMVDLRLSPRDRPTDLDITSAYLQRAQAADGLADCLRNTTLSDVVTSFCCTWRASIMATTASHEITFRRQ